MSERTPDGARIEELEREVAELRARLDRGEQGGLDADDLDAAGAYGDVAEAAAAPANRAKIVLVAVVVVALALGVMLAVFQALSGGINKLAPKAATMFSPEGSQGGAAGAEPAPAKPQGEDKDAPRVPGL